MSSLISLSKISKSYSINPLFVELSMTIEAAARVGILGPNGSGKSTLLKIIAGLEECDRGQVVRRRGLRVSYVSQTAEFTEQDRVFELIQAAASLNSFDETESDRRVRGALQAFDLGDGNQRPQQLSGGQQKRVQLAIAIAEDPELLLLDEPTNHLDIESIIELEQFLSELRCSWVAVSHDRWFLENAVNRISEVNPRYPNGIFSCGGAYSEYLAARDIFLETAAAQHQSLENRVRRESEWLSRGPKARTSKAKHRINKAHALMESLSLVRARQRDAKADISFVTSSKKTKKLIELFNCSKSLGGQALFSKLNLKILAGTALGLLGRNGSGKTTFLKVLTAELPPDSGTVKAVEGLTISYFKQIDSSIAADLPLKRVLSTHGDSVVYCGRSIHLSSWAQRFQFRHDMLEQPYGNLSGGEQARARIARIMLETPDVLVLDEPTNDIDISILEMLEQGLLEFKGAIVLVTHDRFLLNRICTSFLGFNGKGTVKTYANYSQWERDVAAIEEDEQQDVAQEKTAADKTSSASLSYQDRKELSRIESKITKAEGRVEKLDLALSVASKDANSEKVQARYLELKAAQDEVDELYQRWEELAQKS